MATEQRMNNLIQYCEGLKESTNEAEKKRDDLIALKNMGVSSINENGDDLIEIMIGEADKAALIYKNIQTKMEALRDRAIAGEDV